MSACKLVDSKLFCNDKLVCDLWNTNPGQVRNYLMQKPEYADELFELVREFWASDYVKFMFSVRIQ